MSTLPAGATKVADGPLFQKVRPDDCNWTLQDSKEGRIISLTLEKQVKMLGVKEEVHAMAGWRPRPPPSESL